LAERLQQVIISLWFMQTSLDSLNQELFKIA
jgi:hypothetical protein